MMAMVEPAATASGSPADRGVQERQRHRVDHFRLESCPPENSYPGLDQRLGRPHHQDGLPLLVFDERVADHLAVQRRLGDVFQGRCCRDS
jgi:hypothetical protein